MLLRTLCFFILSVSPLQIIASNETDRNSDENLQNFQCANECISPDENEGDEGDENEGPFLSRDRFIYMLENNDVGSLRRLFDSLRGQHTNLHLELQTHPIEILSHALHNPDLSYLLLEQMANLHTVIDQAAITEVYIRLLSSIPEGRRDLREAAKLKFNRSFQLIMSYIINIPGGRERFRSEAILRILTEYRKFKKDPSTEHARETVENEAQKSRKRPTEDIENDENSVPSGSSASSPKLTQTTRSILSQSSSSSQ